MTARFCARCHLRGVMPCGLGDLDHLLLSLRHLADDRLTPPQRDGVRAIVFRHPEHGVSVLMAGALEHVRHREDAVRLLRRVGL